MRSISDRRSTSNVEVEKWSAADIGLSHKDIHEARLIRDAEDANPGIIRLLDDPEWLKWSDREIARKCGVLQPFASNLRPSDNGYQIDRTYTTKQGPSEAV